VIWHGDEDNSEGKKTHDDEVDSSMDSKILNKSISTGFNQQLRKFSFVFHNLKEL